MGYRLGDRFKWRLPKFIGRISDISDLFQAEDREFSAIDRRLFDFSKAMFMSTLKEAKEVPFYLKKLERDYGLSSYGTIDARIARILVKMKGKGVTNEAAIVDLCKVFGYRVLFHERYKEYGFTLDFQDPKKLTADVLTAVEEIKPAHLNMSLKVSNHLYLWLKTQYDHLTYPIVLCGERSCGTIPEDKYVGRGLKTVLGVNIGVNYAKGYYGYTSDGHKAGQLRADGSQGVIYMQDMARDVLYRFKEDV